MYQRSQSSSYERKLTGAEQGRVSGDEDLKGSARGVWTLHQLLRLLFLLLNKNTSGFHLFPQVMSGKLAFRHHATRGWPSRRGLRLAWVTEQMATSKLSG